MAMLQRASHSVSALRGHLAVIVSAYCSSVGCGCVCDAAVCGTSGARCLFVVQLGGRATAPHLLALLSKILWDTLGNYIHKLFCSCALCCS